MNPLIDKAARFAAIKHDGQYRKGSNIPYITHPFGVAMILMEEKQPDSLIAAGLLHDTLEDTEVTEEELFEHFGEEILMLVKAASEPDKTLSWELRKQHTIANLPSHSTEELYLILADKLHNLRSVQADVLKQGNAVWGRFKRGKREQSWYYMSIVHELRARKREIPLIRKLEEEAMELFTGKKRLSVHDIQLLFTCFRSVELAEREELERSGLAVFAGELWEKAESDSGTETQGASIPFRPESEQTGSQQPKDQAADPYEDACLQELKYRLAWDDELFRKYFNDFYSPD
ncbi:HD domain-containing protein [Planococcus salinarum]|uniref:HD domain-containing protein n=1 Tax=Planococcus salinarum TaxID=622695 RepID=UPI000E3C1001|nr:HD domain-containing protein [Planococcus salinarum]TAA72727.1 bifunctional (p)ppGpp synthetase/guanosine-3',5'-bis(diphosphate) 3'-pyrophosphohydrolase [Planococcus salinarum]